MKTLFAIVLAFFGVAYAGVIGSPNDHMGMGMGPVIDSSLQPAPVAGADAPRVRAQPYAPTKVSGLGDFRTICGFSHTAFDDPLVWPGNPGKSHLHTFFGNTSTDAFSTDASLAAGSSTCHGGTLNRSAYWVPSLIDTRTGAAVKPKYLLIYYKSDVWDFSPTPARVEPIPQGLRMIAGSAKNSAPSAAFSYKCDGNMPAYGSIPNCAAGHEMWIFLPFPRCWDGVNLDSPDHKSHMAYPANGACPATHPVKLAHISYLVEYSVPEAGWDQFMRLSSDMYDESIPGGYSMHGDYWMKWDDPTMRQAIEGCVNGGFSTTDLLCNGQLMY